MIDKPIHQEALTRAVIAERGMEELRMQISQLHLFLDEIWGTYKLNTAFRQRILAAKAGRWNTALLNITLTDADREIIANGSNAYANRKVTPGTEHCEELVVPIR